jgi:N6-adenosine-specific RNA methylase IME4
VSAPFHVVMADPPWPFRDKIQGQKRGAAKHYRLMAMHHILTFPLPPIADDAVLFLWRVSAMQQEALDVASAWGFEVKTELVWRKLTTRGKRHFGMGRTLRAEHETCLVAHRGRPTVLNRSTRSIVGDDTVFDAVVGRHSAKPEAIYSLIESLYSGPYLSVFDRREREGWTCLGDQVDLDVPYAGPCVDSKLP